MQGRDAEAQLQRLAANNVAVPIGATVYTGILNERGTFESDLTIARLARDKFLIITGSAQPVRDMDWLEPPCRRECPRHADRRDRRLDRAVGDGARAAARCCRR